MRNVLLTGLPRSGTTLICHLLNKLPDTVALHEPLNQELMLVEPALIIESINQFLSAQRIQILSSGSAVSKAMDGRVPTNPLGDDVVDGRRTNQLNGKLIKVSNVNSEDFSLYIKHPAFFTGHLPELVRNFECYAIIRNPLALLLSWRNANMPITRGRAPNAELASPTLLRELDREPDVIARQLIILDFFCERYWTYLQHKVVRYEDLINTGGKSMSLIEPRALQLNEELESRNLRCINIDPATRQIADRLLESSNACWQYYQRMDVISLIEPT